MSKSDDTISRKAAIDVIEKIFPADPMRNDYTQGITCGAALATEYIKQLPSAQQDSKETSPTHKALDTISRQDAIRIVDGIDTWQAGWRGDAIESMKALPPAQPETHEERTETHGVCLDTINRQAALDWLKNEWNGMVTSLFDGIKALPSAESEIIRCKDCAHWMPHCQLGFDIDNEEYHDYCGRLIPEDEYYAFYRNADDYCSRAERRTDEA